MQENIYSIQDPLSVLQSFVDSNNYTNEESSNANGNDNSMFGDIDFSEIKGKTNKQIISKANAKIRSKKLMTSINKKRKNALPLTKKHPIKQNSTTNIKTKHLSGKSKSIKNILVSNDQKVIINGVSNFMIDKTKDSLRNIGYWEGKKLNKLLLTFNNTNGNDLTLDLFNPNSWGKYFMANSQDLDDRIIVGDGSIKYSEVLFNIIANPTMIPSARFSFSCPTEEQLERQLNVPLNFTNKDLRSNTVVKPYTFEIDEYQFQNNIVLFDIIESINRPFFPNGTDTAIYTIYAGTTASLCFYYKQYTLIEQFFKLAYTKRKDLNKDIFN